MAKRESALAKMARMANQIIEGPRHADYERERKANAEYSAKKRAEEARKKAEKAAAGKGGKGIMGRTEDVSARLDTAGLTAEEIRKLKKGKR